MFKHVAFSIIAIFSRNIGTISRTSLGLKLCLSGFYLLKLVSRQVLATRVWAQTPTIISESIGASKVWNFKFESRSPTEYEQRGDQVSYNIAPF